MTGSLTMCWSRITKASTKLMIFAPIRGVAVSSNTKLGLRLRSMSWDRLLVTLWLSSTMITGFKPAIEATSENGSTPSPTATAVDAKSSRALFSW
ncbi:hypothetical protein D3C81_1922110 [compost metagenome]